MWSLHICQVSGQHAGGLTTTYQEVCSVTEQ